MNRPRHLRVGEETTLSRTEWRRLRSAQERVGEIVTLSGAEGKAFRGRVVELAADQVRLFVFEELGGPVESGLRVTLLQALPDKERMELIIQKATELGAAVIVPFHSRRSIRLAEREQKQKKAHRWPAIALAAARQCRREQVPVVAPVVELEGALGWARECETKVALWEKEKTRGLREVLQGPPPASAALLVGPEGGLEVEEIECLRQAGFQIASLGRRILRTETAAIAGLTILQYVWGDWGPPVDKKHLNSPPSRS